MISILVISSMIMPIRIINRLINKRRTILLLVRLIAEVNPQHMPVVCEGRFWQLSRNADRISIGLGCCPGEVSYSSAKIKSYGYWTGCSLIKWWYHWYHLNHPIIWREYLWYSSLVSSIASKLGLSMVIRKSAIAAESNKVSFVLLGFNYISSWDWKL